jgi:UPF0716 protein FxsA
MGRLFLLFTVVPAIELYLLLVLGDWLGAAQTVGLLLLSGVAGAWLVRSQGAAVLAELSESLRGGGSPAPKLVEGALVLAGGLLLVTPGVFTDLVAVLILLPPIRRALAPTVLRALVDWGAARGTFVHLGADAVNAARNQSSPPHPPFGAPPRNAAGPSPGAPPRGRSPFDHPTA